MFRSIGLLLRGKICQLSRKTRALCWSIFSLETIQTSSEAVSYKCDCLKNVCSFDFVKSSVIDDNIIDYLGLRKPMTKFRTRKLGGLGW